MHLYWVTDDQNDEDWFVVAPSARAARRFYADDLDMDYSAVLSADLVAKNVSGDRTEAGWATDAEIESVGGTVWHGPNHSEAVVGGEVYVEGSLQYRIVKTRFPKPTSKVRH